MIEHRRPADSIQFMLRDEPTIRPSLYRLPQDPVAERILVPAFRQATGVRGAFGWFSAGWIGRLAHGLSVYLARKDVGPIQFVIAPALFPAEYEALKSATSRTHHVIRRLQEIFEEASSPTVDHLTRYAVDCLAWMVINGRLRLRVAKVRPGANYHPKIWLFYDRVDVVAVRGSANATGRAYSRGVEHMDVDCTWDNRSRVDIAAAMVDDWWNGKDEEIEETLELPDALRGTLKKLAPAGMPSLEGYEAAVKEAPVLRNVARIEDPDMFHIPSGLSWSEGKYAHQGDAVKAWESHGRRGVIEMATGAGKTIAALICAYRAWQEHQGPFLLVVSAPSTPLLLQWRSECERFGLKAVAPTLSGSRSRKHADIGNCLIRLRGAASGHIEAIIVTNNLLASSGFQNSLQDAKGRTQNLRIMHVGDEAHTLGSPSFVRSPPEFMDLRLGLSATPVRQYDDAGTSHLFNYFGPPVYRFGLDRAIGFCLVPYDYHIHVAELSEAELAEFRELSVRIGRLVARAGGILDPANEALTALLVRRRSVVETAEGKISVLRDILEARKRPTWHTLIYTSSKNPAQLVAAKRVAADAGFIINQVTEQETRDRPRLERILRRFAKGEIDALIAKRVLDEGVDIPQTREAILLASSSVEREWVQRRGRVLRPSPGKDSAAIHDVIALPPPRDGMYDDPVLQFVSSELDRVRAFGRYARNKNEVADLVANVHDQYFME